jgi:hypothetical protein
MLVCGSIAPRRGGKTPARCRQDAGKMPALPVMGREIVRAWGAAVLRSYNCRLELSEGAMRSYSCCFPKGDRACSFWKPKGRLVRLECDGGVLLATRIRREGWR